MLKPGFTYRPTLSAALARRFECVIEVDPTIPHPEPSPVYGYCPAGETRGGQIIYYYSATGEMVARSCDKRGRPDGPPWRGRGPIGFAPSAWRKSSRNILYVRPGVDADEVNAAELGAQES